MITNPYRNASGEPATAPIHWWNLDDDGTWADNGTGGWSNLIENGSPDTVAQGPNGQNVLRIDATSEYLDTSGNQSWDGGSSGRSHSMWVQRYTGSYSANQRFLYWTTASGGEPIVNFLYRHSSTSFRASFEDTSSNIISLDSTTTPSTGTWYHVVLTYDGTTARLYVNGSEEASSSTPSLGTLEGSISCPFCIGVDTRDENSDFANDHYLAMCGIWDVELTSDDVSALYNSGNGLSYDGSTWS